MPMHRALAAFLIFASLALAGCAPPPPAPEPALISLPSSTPTTNPTAAPTQLLTVPQATPPTAGPTVPAPTLDPALTAIFAPTPITPTVPTGPTECAGRWRIAPAPELCPAQGGASPAAWQPLERGVMVQIAQLERVYIFYADARYDSELDRWDAGMPDEDPALVPPEGLFEPVRAIGKVWREAGLLNALGWGTAAETGYSAMLQCEAVNQSVCYLSGPSGEVIRMDGDTDTWAWWAAPSP